MNNLSAAQKRYLDNATLIAASKLIFLRLEEMGAPIETLGKIAKTTSGGTPSRGDESYFGGSIPWIKSGELNNGVIEKAEEFITEGGLNNSSAKIFPKGTLVIALYGATVGKTGILGLDAASNQAVCAIFPKAGKINLNYLHWYLRHKRQDFLEGSFGGAQPNISQKLLRQTEIPIPNKDLQELICQFLDAVEQRKNGKSISLPHLPELLIDIRRIVARIEALAGKVEEARRLRETAVVETEAIIESTAREVLSKLNVEISELNSWLVPDKKGIQTGPFGTQLSSKEFVSEGIPVLTIGNVQYGGLELKGLKYVTPQKAKQLSRFELEEGDILFARMGTVGRSCVVPKDAEKWLYNYHIIRVRLDKSKVISRFIHWTIRTSKDVNEYLGENIRGATRQGVNSKIVGGLPCRIPSLERQQEIVNYLDNLQDQLDDLHHFQGATQAELDALLPAILDKAFKGEL